MKTNNKSYNEPVDKQRYKKNYLQRKLEEHEAEKELEQWRKTNHDKTITDREAD